MAKTAIVIPAYIKADSPQEISKTTGFKMLKRALKSLEILKNGELDIILPFCIEGKGIDEDTAKGYHSLLMETLAYPFPFRRVILTAYNLNAVKERILRNGFSDIAEKLNVCGFPNIRNCGLIISQALGAEVTIFLDNDEIIEDPDFLHVALEGVTEPADGMKMDGKGGLYISKDGGIYEKTTPPWWQVSWNKSKLFQAVWEAIIESKDRFVESPVVLGGNLVLSRRLFERIPFDPLIPRGEDIDYLINARLAGLKVLFDKHLKIKHLPLERTFSYRKEELKGDIERFLYERAKVMGHKGLNLSPYPGYFLKWDMEIKAVITIILFSLYLASNNQWVESIKVYTYLKSLFRKRKDIGFYKQFRQRWAPFMEFIRLDGLKDILKESSL
ncbi:MAG: hypothetical protein Q8P28_11300 [Deltaproteobacteria bacterium]|nr:hypothetical protein [Deltaproteobacteria bacterium]